MRFSQKPKTVQAWIKMIRDNDMSFDHPLQREEGQWSNATASKFIRLLIKQIPMPNCYAQYIDNILKPIDGVQRFTTIRDFYADEFALAEDTKDVIIKETSYTIAGKKFSELDEQVKDAFLNTEISMYEIMDATEEDIRDMFEGLNSGKPLNAKQLRPVYESNEFREAVKSLANHAFIQNNTTAAQHRNASDRDMIRQTFMLLATDDTHDYTSFRKDDINAFVLEDGDEQLGKVEQFKKLLEQLSANIGDKKLRMPYTSFPMMLACGFEFIDDHEKIEKYANAVRDFAKNYKSNNTYKSYGTSGTTDSKVIKKKFNYWQRLASNCK